MLLWLRCALAPVLTGDTPRVAADYGITEMSSGTAIRTPSHMYYLPYTSEGSRQLDAQPTQFFDVRTDPYEFNNLVGTEVDAEIASELDQILRDWDQASASKA